MPAGSEAITIDTGSWAPGTTVVFIAVVFRSFELVRLGPVECRVVDPKSGRDLQTFTTPYTDRPHNCRVLARVSESAVGRWELTPIGDTSVGRTLAEFASATRRHV